MKTLFLTFIIGFSFFNNFLISEKEDVTNLDFECKITTKETVVKLGIVPEITVEIINKTSKEVYFIKDLDGSEMKKKMPYCYFTIEEPMKRNVSKVASCGTMNPLKPEDFIELKSNESFDPYADYNNNLNVIEMRVIDNFKIPGVYRIQFHYSTNSKSLDDFIGNEYNTDRKILQQLLDKVPKIELKSNILEIEVRK